MCACVCVCVYSTQWWIPDAGISFVGASKFRTCQIALLSSHTVEYFYTHPHTLQNPCPLILLHPRLRGSRSCRLIQSWLVLLCFISPLLSFCSPPLVFALTPLLNYFFFYLSICFYPQLLLPRERKTLLIISIFLLLSFLLLSLQQCICSHQQVFVLQLTCSNLITDSEGHYRSHDRAGRSCRELISSVTSAQRSAQQPSPYHILKIALCPHWRRHPFPSPFGSAAPFPLLLPHSFSPSLSSPLSPFALSFFHALLLQLSRLCRLPPSLPFFFLFVISLFVFLDNCSNSIKESSLYLCWLLSSRRLSLTVGLKF